MNSNDLLSIGDLARRTGLSASAIRFYEDKGLLAPARQGQARIYSRADRTRLALILRGKRLGFSLAEIQELLDLYDPADGQVEQIRQLNMKAADRISELERQAAEIESMLRELRLAHQLNRTKLISPAAGGTCRPPAPRARPHPTRSPWPPELVASGARLGRPPKLRSPLSAAPSTGRARVHRNLLHHGLEAGVLVSSSDAAGAPRHRYRRRHLPLPPLAHSIPIPHLLRRSFD